MGRNCSTVFNRKPWTSGCAINNEKVPMHGFPVDAYQKEQRVKALSNVISVGNVTKICQLVGNNGILIVR